MTPSKGGNEIHAVAEDVLSCLLLLFVGPFIIGPRGYVAVRVRVRTLVLHHERTMTDWMLGHDVGSRLFKLLLIPFLSVMLRVGRPDARTHSRISILLSALRPRTTVRCGCSAGSCSTRSQRLSSSTSSPVPRSLQLPLMQEEASQRRRQIPRLRRVTLQFLVTIPRPI